MRLLLDTHAMIWWWTDRSRLPVTVAAAIAEDAEAVFASSVCAWEIATKARLGKLPIFAAYISQLPDMVIASGFNPLPVDQNHGLRAGAYEAEHRDPFDRMLAAQAELENLTLVTRDTAFAVFPCKVMW